MKKVIDVFNAKTECGKNDFNNKDNKFLFSCCNDDLDGNDKNNVNN